MSAQLIVWPKVIQQVRAELDAGMAPFDGFQTVKAFGVVPSTRPKRFTRVLRSGGQQIDLVTLEPLIIVESWGTSDEDAEAIADRNHAIMLRAAINGWMGEYPCRGVRVASSPQRLPDTTSPFRYSAMYAPQLRGVIA